MVIVHFSDWHGQIHKLPEADLYVATGDLYANYVRYVNKKLSLTDSGPTYVVDNEYDARQQEKFAKKCGAGQMREALGSPDAPLVCVRGNHDFTDARHLFAECNLVHEFMNNEIIEVAGMHVTGHRGCPLINGTWSDEMNSADLKDRVRAMGQTCNLYLTHYPSDGSGLGGPWGFAGMGGWFDYHCRTKHPVHCFGHVHEKFGWSKLGGLLSSNASEWYNVIEGSPTDGWRVRE